VDTGKYTCCQRQDKPDHGNMAPGDHISLYQKWGFVPLG
jgi:hypothetical protein